jgi:pimeloyl-ACP methyl ester carboxylesterase
MLHVEVEPGVRLFVQDLGTGRPIVLLAGFGLSHEVWDGQVRVLGERHRVLCVDLRGHGRSDRPLGDYGIDRLARDVQAVLAQLDLTGVTLVGWSFGGQVAFRIAAAAPERLSQLVLVASNGVRASRSAEFPFGAPPEELEPSLIRAELTSRAAARRSTILSGFHQVPDEDTLSWLVRCSLQMPSWAAVACYRSMLRTDLVGDLPRVTVPVLQVIGEMDPVHSSGGARWLNERLADARLVELADCGHYPMFEAADEFNQALLDFVAQAPAG